jgi:precorrin-3B synthase
MNAAETTRRGACPGLTTPMPTGDGLLVRLMPIGTLSLDAMAGLCAAAQQHGNGILEVTSRGSLQVRGLSEASAAKFADAVAQLAIAAQEGVPVITDPLAGLDPSEVIDAGALAAEVRHELVMRGLVPRIHEFAADKQDVDGRDKPGHDGSNILSPKVSVAIDGGGAVHIDSLAADVRLCAVATSGGPRLRVAIGGDAASAVPHGTIEIDDAIETVVALLTKITARGPAARGRDLVERTGTPSPPCAAADPIGLHPLRDGTRAFGLGFPFGHTDAATLDKLLRAARDTGARGLRTAPGRALLVIGVAADRVVALVDAAARLGFIVDRDDPRRRVVACAGAPVCAAAHIPARTLAPEIAKSAAALLGAHDVIHVSGCRKGCAHQGPAAFTAIGREGACDLLAGDRPAGSCAAEALPQRLAALAAQRSARHG